MFGVLGEELGVEEGDGGSGLVESDVDEEEGVMVGLSYRTYKKKVSLLINLVFYIQTAWVLH